MMQPKIRTEYHFNAAEKVYARLPRVTQTLRDLGTTAAGIMDCTTYGHIPFYRAMQAADINPLLGVEYVCPDGERVGLIALSDAGLRDLYHYTSTRESNPVPFANIGDLPDALAKLMITPGDGRGWRNGFAVVDPVDPRIVRERLASKLMPLVCSDNWYVHPGDRAAFQMMGGAVRADPLQQQHILTAGELSRLAARYELDPRPANRGRRITPDELKAVRVGLPIANNLQVDGDLLALARKGKHRVARWSAVYDRRLKHEIAMIREKGFESYLLLLADLVGWAKRKMLVGPGRGSSAGSLVCYLTEITDIDPIPHGLLFERFIDLTRNDLPDIDCDFPDNQRESVIDYLRGKYGADCVARLGTIQTWQPRSILVDVGKRMQIPPWELSKLKSALIERTAGDERAEQCLLDTLESERETDIKYPLLRRVTGFEGHAKYSGTHAAGVLVCGEPVQRFATVQADGTAQLDKRDAEAINLLKIDLLGLRTLTVLQDAAGVAFDFLAIPLDDPLAFGLLNQGKVAGVFQFEGQAVRALAQSMAGHINQFSDLVALTALARPGPLSSGGAASFVQRRIGREPVTHLHPLIEPYTRETYGIIIYQEQVMQIARDVGGLDWADVTALRKAMSKSLGADYFDKYWTKFRDGPHGMKEAAARHVWDSMNTLGAWAFNKSHAVAYALLSYWCAYMKAHHLLDFAAATLRNARDDDQATALLRELKSEGVQYVAFDAQKSQVNWSVQGGRLVGGFLNIKGVGEVKAQKYFEDRGQWTEKQKEFLANAEILFAEISPCETRYGHIYDDPRASGYRLSTVHRIAEITDDVERVTFIGQLKQKNLRDLNEYVFQVKRRQEGKPELLSGVPTQYLNLLMADDTGQLYCGISARDFDEVGRDIVDRGVIDESYYLMQGFRNRIGRINVTWAKMLD